MDIFLFCANLNPLLDFSCSGLCFNGAAAGTNHVVTLVTAASGTVLGTVSVGGGERIIIKKDPSEVLYAANAAVLLTKVNPNVT